MVDLKGPKPNDEGQSVELNWKVQAAVVYLFGLHQNHPNAESKWIWIGGLRGGGDEFEELAQYIGKTFPLPFIFGQPHQFVSNYFTTVRDRLECRQWLSNLFVEMNLDMSILDRAFPPVQN